MTEDASGSEQTSSSRFVAEDIFDALLRTNVLSACDVVRAIEIAEEELEVIRVYGHIEYPHDPEVALD